MHRLFVYLCMVYLCRVYLCVVYLRRVYLCMVYTNHALKIPYINLITQCKCEYSFMRPWFLGTCKHQGRIPCTSSITTPTPTINSTTADINCMRGGYHASATSPTPTPTASTEPGSSNSIYHIQLYLLLVGVAIAAILM